MKLCGWCLTEQNTSMWDVSFLCCTLSIMIFVSGVANITCCASKPTGSQTLFLEICWKKPCTCRELQFRHSCYLPISSPLLFKPVFLLICLFLFFRTVCAEILYFIIDISGTGYSANIFTALCTVLILHLLKSCEGKYIPGSRNMQFCGLFLWCSTQRTVQSLAQVF